MGFFDDLFHPKKAYDEAQGVMNDYYGKGQGYLDPYNQGGQQYGGKLKDMFDKLSDPKALQDEWSQGYEKSPYAQQMQQEASAGGMDAAAGMGLGGSSAALSNIQKGAANIMQQDRQQYMQDMMQKYMAAMGLGQGKYNTGANAAGKQSENAMNMGNWSGGNAFNKQQAGVNMAGKGLGTIASLAGKFFGFS